MRRSAHRAQKAANALHEVPRAFCRRTLRTCLHTYRNLAYDFCGMSNIQCVNLSPCMIRACALKNVSDVIPIRSHDISVLLQVLSLQQQHFWTMSIISMSRLETPRQIPQDIMTRCVRVYWWFLGHQGTGMPEYNHVASREVRNGRSPTDLLTRLPEVSVLAQGR